jgi:hypothetical protein
MHVLRVPKNPELHATTWSHDCCWACVTTPAPRSLGGQLAPTTCHRAESGVPHCEVRTSGAGERRTRTPRPGTYAAEFEVTKVMDGDSNGCAEAASGGLIAARSCRHAAPRCEPWDHERPDCGKWDTRFALAWHR